MAYIMLKCWTGLLIHHNIHNVITSHKRLFAGEHNPSIFRLLYTNNLGVQQHAFNSLLYLRVIQDKYISLYRELIIQLKYTTHIIILQKFLFKYNSKYLYIYLLYGLNDHNNIGHLSVL